MNAFDSLLKKRKDPQLIKFKEEFIQKQRSIINIFLNAAEEWLAPYKQAGDISFHLCHDWQVKNDEIGEFTADWIKVIFEESEIYITPLDNILVDALSRIDMWRSGKRFVFLYVEKDNDGQTPVLKEPDINTDVLKDYEWKLMKKGVFPEYVNLDKEVFLDSLGKLLDGTAN